MYFFQFCQRSLILSLAVISLTQGACSKSLNSPAVAAGPSVNDVVTAKNGNMGGESSGGGEVIKDANNPWFVINTKKVTYCFSIDEARFSGITTPIDTIVTKAIKYWEHEFARAEQRKFNHDHPTGVATQEFIKRDCDDSVDLKFQFGMLEKSQRKYLKDPTHWVSVAVRTQYDTVNLKGKGFIYVSPDSGPLQYQKVPGTHDNVWHSDDGQSLYLVLLHELGHVFGIPHMDFGYDGLMSETFPQRITMSNGISSPGPDYWYEMNHPFLNFFEPGDLRHDKVFKVADDFFEVLNRPAAYDDCHLFFNFKGNTIEVNQWDTSKPVNAPITVIGVITLDSSYKETFHRRNLGSINIYLPPEQKIFDLSKDITYPLYPFESVDLYSYDQPGTYTASKSGHERSVLVEYGPEGWSINGVVNSKIVTNLASGN